jgi:hypothetical protein
MEGSVSGGVSNSIMSNGMNRAERFEDEKRRIIESCFGKKDSEDGSRMFTGKVYFDIMSSC